MNKLFTLISAALVSIGANAQTAADSTTVSYVANQSGTFATEFASVIDANNVATNASNGTSLVSIIKDGITVKAVGGTTPKAILQDGTVTEWNDIAWNNKNQGDISFFYIAGTGNPYVAITAEEIMTDGVGTGEYRAAYTFYEADGSTGMPISGLYYKFTPAYSGKLKIGVWSNKGNRNTFVVDDATKLPVNYTTEGYINGQNENGAKKYLSSAEIQAIHDAAKVVDGVDTAPYVIGGGNQPFWGYIFVTVEAGKTYWLFQHSSQIGFAGFDYTYKTTDATGVNSIVTNEDNDNAPMYNLGGQRVSKSYKGVVIQNGKKLVNK